MTDIYLPELMELDSYWENAVREAAESTVHSRKRLEFALHNRKKINKILENCGYKLSNMQMMRNGRQRDEGDSTDEDDALTASSHDTKFQPESANEREDGGKARSGPSGRRKGKLTPAKRNYLKEKNRACLGGTAGKRMEKRRPNFVRELMDEDGEESCSSSNHSTNSKTNPDMLRKKKLAVITAEIKKRKRNTNTKRPERRAKNLRMKGKTCKTKRPRRKLDRDSDNRDEKQEPKPKNQETKVENSNPNGANGNVNNEDIKKGSVPGKEVPVMKKVSQNDSKHASNPTGPPKPEKDHSKGDCSQDPKPKEHDISKCGDVCTKMAMDNGMMRGPPWLCAVKRLNRNCLGSRRMKCKQKRRGKKKTRPFIKFYLTVFKELWGTCSIKSIAKEAGERWRCMSRKEKLKFYPRKCK